MPEYLMIGFDTIEAIGDAEIKRKMRTYPPNCTIAHRWEDGHITIKCEHRFSAYSDEDAISEAKDWEYGHKDVYRLNLIKGWDIEEEKFEKEAEIWSG